MRTRSFVPIAAVTAAFVTLLATATPGAAADLPLKAPPVPLVVPWTGFYFGPNIGYGWAKKKFVDNFPEFDGEIDAITQPKGVLGGFQMGYNYAFNWLVLGVEGDFAWSGIKKNDFTCFSFGDQLCSAQPQWFADIAGRIGIASGPWLFYAKGGGAWVRDHFTNIATCAGSQPTVVDGVAAACGDQFFANQTRFGWLLGGGVEQYIAPQWSIKLEYNYMDFGHRSVSFEDDGGGFFTEEIHQKVQVVKAGINYHFAPAAAATTTTPIFYKARPATAASDNVVVFSGFDTSKFSYSGWLGAGIAPFGNLETSGWRVFMLGEGGAYKYPAGDTSIHGVSTGGDLLAGYGFEGENYSANLLAGVNAANNMLSAVDTENPVQGTAVGVKGHADLRVNPTSQTLIFTEGEYSTAFKTYYTTAKLGYEFVKGSGIFAGPEAAYLGDARFNQWRLGGHLTQIALGPLQFDISGGYAKDSSVGAGAYGHIEISRSF